MKTLDSQTANLPVWAIGFDGVPRFRRLLLLWLNCMVPILVLAAFSSGVAHTQSQLDEIIVVSLLEALVVAFPYLWASNRRTDARLAHIIALIVHVLAGCYWLFGLHGGMALLVLLTFYFFILMTRHHLLYQTHSVTASNRTALKTDTLVIFFITLYYYWWALSMGGELQASLKPFFAGWLLALVALRLYSLWSLERIETNTHHVSSRNVWFFVIVVLLLGVFEARGLFGAFLRLEGLVALLLTPIMYVMPQFHLVRHPEQTTNQTSSNTTNAVSHVVHGNHLGIVHIVIYVLISVALLVTLYWLLRRNQETGGEDAKARNTPQITRRSLRSKLPFYSTDNPIRLQAQEWMKQEFKQQRLPKERTWHQMTNGATRVPVSQKLVDEYEHIRYGTQGEMLQLGAFQKDSAQTPKEIPATEDEIRPDE